MPKFVAKGFSVGNFQRIVTLFSNEEVEMAVGEWL
jgi:hypothetical protein